MGFVRQMRELRVFTDQGEVCIQQPDNCGEIDQINVAPDQIEKLVDWLREAAESARQESEQTF